jgi:hypothetical protein
MPAQLVDLPAEPVRVRILDIPDEDLVADDEYLYAHRI